MCNLQSGQDTQKTTALCLRELTRFPSSANTGYQGRSPCLVSHEEFLRRFLQHVLRTGFPRIPTSAFSPIVVAACFCRYAATCSRLLLLLLPQALPPTLDPACPRRQAPMRIIEPLTAFQLEYENHRLVVDLDSS